MVRINPASVKLTIVQTIAFIVQILVILLDRLLLFLSTYNKSFYANVPFKGTS